MFLFLFPSGRLCEEFVKKECDLLTRGMNKGEMAEKGAKDRGKVENILQLR